MHIPQQIAGVPTKIGIPVVLAGVAYVGWRYYQARSGTGADAAGSTVADGDFGAVDSSVPGVLGAVSPTNSYGLNTGSTDTGDAGNNPAKFTSDSQWTNYVTDKLQQSDTWSYTDIVTALGNYLATKPMTDIQKTIAQAAIAVGDYPPSGAKSIVSGGNASLTIQPANVHVQATTEESATVAFNPVDGAASYSAYLSGVTPPVGTSSSSPITIPNLRPNTTYTAYITPFTAAGVAGPRSAGASFKTDSYNLATPAKPSVSSVTTSGARASTGAVAHADRYLWYVNGGLQSETTSPATTITGLHSKRKYTVIVKAALSGNAAMSQHSPEAAFTTK